MFSQVKPLFLEGMIGVETVLAFHRVFPFPDSPPVFPWFSTSFLQLQDQLPKGFELFVQVVVFS